MTDPTPSSKTCARCGFTYPADVAEGLCPRCLGALNFEGETTALEPGDDPRPRPNPPAPEDLAPYFPQLEILECLGRGGMGIVYKARQKSLDRFVALKLLAPEREKDAEFAARFAQEAQALAVLSHPHIVTVHDFGQSHGYFFLIMEFVDGPNLRDLLRARRLTPEEALGIVPPLCEALQFAHDRGIVHCDIKPENLLLDREGRVKVAGTPAYMAPEQSSRPHTVDSRADIFSLGVVFYEMLTGELPGATLQPPSHKARIDVRIDEVVLRALEKRPTLRWQTAADLRTEVESIAAHPPLGNKATPPPIHPPSPPSFWQWYATPERNRKFWRILLVLLPASVLLGFCVPRIQSTRARQATPPPQVAPQEPPKPVEAEPEAIVTLKTFAATDLRPPADAASPRHFQVSGPATDPMITLDHATSTPIVAEIFTLESPGIDSPQYMLSGEVRYENVENTGFLELWSHFGPGAYFSRTLGAIGPMAALTGTSDWRPFLLPFNATGASNPSYPTKLVFNIQLPGKGKVQLRQLKLQQQSQRP